MLFGQAELNKKVADNNGTEKIADVVKADQKHHSLLLQVLNCLSKVFCMLSSDVARS